MPHHDNRRRNDGGHVQSCHVGKAKLTDGAYLLRDRRGRFLKVLLASPGTFSCNALFYQQLAAQKKHRDVLKQVMFMHVPALKRNNTTHSKRIDDYAKKLADKIFNYLSSALE